MRIAQRLLAADRRIVFLLIAFAIIVPLYVPFNIPSSGVSEPVRGVFDKIDSMPAGSSMLLSMDFDPTSKPELLPMAVAILKHAFARDIKVVGMTLWLTGTGMAENAFVSGAEEMHKERYVDYVFLGWQVQPYSVIINMGQDLHGIWPKDYYGKTMAEIPMMETLRSLKDFDYVVCVAAGDPGLGAWYMYGAEKHKFVLGGGCTGVIAPGMYPFLQAKQINGLIAGMKGAAEYEELLEKKMKGGRGAACAGMDSQSAAHFLIIALVVVGNILYFVSRGAGKSAPTQAS
ncbi:MAG: hypothetical protein RDV41_03215 [Planctomycetota bacterium]|nr:hypothetical protein [Planctomycetota bacterium]